MYEYRFSVWPDEESPRNQSCPQIYTLFQFLNHRVGMVFTELEFNNFREALFKVGMTLREIERVQHQEPMKVL